MSKKIAVISGASTGIGEDSAVRLAKDGFDLVIAARRKEKLEAVAERCKAEGAEVLVCPADMSKEEDVKRLFDASIEKYGKIDFFFCNQGVLMNPKNFEDQTLDDYNLVADNNFKSVFLALIYSIRIMKEQGYGNILVTGSSSGIRPEAGFGVYSASKHAVVGLVKDAAIECGQFGIRINCLCPGGVWTPMVENATKYMTENSVNLRRQIPTLLPNKPVAQVGEISGMVAFMASEESSYMCGSIISIDNGITQ